MWKMGYLFVGMLSVYMEASGYTVVIVYGLVYGEVRTLT